MHIAPRIKKMERNRSFQLRREAFQFPEENKRKATALIHRSYREPRAANASTRRAFEMVRGLTPTGARAEVLAWKLPEPQCA